MPRSPARRYRVLASIAAGCLVYNALLWLRAEERPFLQAANSEADSKQAPADWGDDHVDEPLPPYVTGDECLFCHREIGAAWGENRHQRTIRPADPDDLALKALRETGSTAGEDIRYLLGSRRQVRFLRRSKSYGKLDLLAARVSPLNQTLHWPETTRDVDDNSQWDTQSFGERCAGCHTTAVETSSRAFSAMSIDCFACHGDVPLDHSNDITKVFLSSSNANPLQVASICGQCHLRGGKSKSSALPYPNTFVAGDNLLRDFQVDFDEATIRSMPLVDQHVYLNLKDVAVLGDTSMTCLTCHDVHDQNSLKHQELDYVSLCANCHAAESDLSELKSVWRDNYRFQDHSHTCDY